jgi:transcriptional regulator with XRE-family HTH domain
MNVKAVGLYFQVLADARGMKRKAVAKKAHVADNYIWRLANEEVREPSRPYIDRLVQVLQGDKELVEDLLATDKEISKEALQRYIDDWIKGAHPDPLIENARLRQARASLDNLINHPRKLDRLLEYADRLDDSRDESSP